MYSYAQSSDSESEVQVTKSTKSKRRDDDGENNRSDRRHSRRKSRRRRSKSRRRSRSRHRSNRDASQRVSSTSRVVTEVNTDDRADPRKRQEPILKSSNNDVVKQVEEKSIDQSAGESIEDKRKRPPTLKDILEAIPGIQITEAIKRLQVLQKLGISAAESAMDMTEAHLRLGMQPYQSVSSSSMLPTSLASSSSSSSDLRSVTKPARELYIGGFPHGMASNQVLEFIGNEMISRHLSSSSSSNPACAAWMSGDGTYAFVEFKSVDEASLALSQLNGIPCQSGTLKVGRPKGYSAETIMQISSSSGIDPTSIGLPKEFVSSIVALGNMASSSSLSNTSLLVTALIMGCNSNLTGALSSSMQASTLICVCNIPAGTDLEDIGHLMSSFGVHVFENSVDNNDDDGTMIIFSRYHDIMTAQSACIGLNLIRINGIKLTAFRIPSSISSCLIQLPTVACFDMETPTNAFIFKNALDDDDMATRESVEDVRLDILEECSKFGAVVNVSVLKDKKQVKVEFASADVALVVRKALTKRIFRGSQIEIQYC